MKEEDTLFKRRDNALPSLEFWYLGLEKPGKHLEFDHLLAAGTLGEGVPVMFSIDTVCVLPIRYDRSQSSAAPSTQKRDFKRVSGISWSTVSKAALRSRSISRTDDLLSIMRRMSLWTRTSLFVCLGV